jgi:hypothetical protein
MNLMLMYSNYSLAMVFSTLYFHGLTSIMSQLLTINYNYILAHYVLMTLQYTHNQHFHFGKNINELYIRTHTMTFKLREWIRQRKIQYAIKRYRP